MNKKVGQTYEYCLTELGRRAVLVGLKREEHLLAPGLATASAGAAKYLAPPARDFPGEGLTAPLCPHRHCRAAWLGWRPPVNLEGMACA